MGYQLWRRWHCLYSSAGSGSLHHCCIGFVWTLWNEWCKRRPVLHSGHVYISAKYVDATVKFSSCFGTAPVEGLARQNETLGKQCTTFAREVATVPACAHCGTACEHSRN